MPVIGTVYLVGAGPGDPRLITIAGANALAKADVVVYDRLAHPNLLALAPPDSEKIYVGKTSGSHTLSQTGINRLLIQLARSGKTVARLKGGDPFVFGRGGEEALALTAAGIPFRIIPGVTSALAAPAYAGIPVTHRGIANSFAVITGHEHENAPMRQTEGGEELRDEGETRFHLDASADTLVFLMGAANLPAIVSSVLESGRSMDTPAAVIQWGTWAGRQKVVSGNLGDIAEKVDAACLTSPVTIIVGETARLREQIRWWDNLPLSGKRVIVTRSRESASSLADALYDAGAEPIEYPVIQIVAPPDRFEALDSALARLRSFDWIVFTSANAVRAFWDRLTALVGDSRVLVSLKIAAVGPATGSALKQIGIIPDFTPTVFTSEETAKQFPEDPLCRNILFPCAAEAGDMLPALLAERHFDVEIAPVYQTIPAGIGVERIIERLNEGSVDIVTFTSSSTVKNFAASLGAEPPSLKHVDIACIGPVTAQTVSEIFHREPDIVAEEYTIAGLMEALVKAYTPAR
jgi:uroporphyrinogen III methyltransferase/synthase